MWVGVCYIISRIGGWTELGTIYRTTNPFPPTRYYFVSAVMRASVNYGSCLTVSADLEGIYLKTFFLFRVFHPPLFIPWGDLDYMEEKIWFMRGIKFTSSKAPGVYFWLYARTAEKLIQQKKA